MRCLCLSVIYILMQIRHKADICHAVGTDSVCCVSLCYFGISIWGKNLLPFQIVLDNFLVEIG